MCRSVESLTCGRGFQQLGRAGPSWLEVLVHKVCKHGHHVGAPPLVPVAVDGQPVAQILSLLPCSHRHTGCANMGSALGCPH